MKIPNFINLIKWLGIDKLFGKDDKFLNQKGNWIQLISSVFPLNRIPYGTGTSWTSDVEFTRDTTTKETTIAFTSPTSGKQFLIHMGDTLDQGGLVTIPHLRLTYNDGNSGANDYSALQILDESGVGGSAYKTVLGNQSDGGNLGVNWITEDDFARVKVGDFNTMTRTDWDFMSDGTFNVDDKTNGVSILLKFLEAVQPPANAVLAVNNTQDEASWITTPTFDSIVIANLGTYANDAAAAVGGVPINGVYRETGTEYLKARVV